VLLALLSLPAPAISQQLAGDWQGMLQIGPAQLQLILRVSGDSATGYRGTLDSPDQNAMGMTLGDVSLAQSRLSFTLPQVGGSYEGTYNEGAGVFVGLWSQGGQSLPLELARRPAGADAPRVPRPGELDGSWQGELAVQGQTVGLVLRIRTYADGLGGTMDVPAQNASGLPVTVLTRQDDRLHLEMRQFAASFDGTLDLANGTLSGTWRQGGADTPLVLRRATQ
jgi:hypothetical protein